MQTFYARGPQYVFPVCIFEHCMSTYLASTYTISVSSLIDLCPTLLDLMWCVDQQLLHRARFMCLWYIALIHIKDPQHHQHLGQK